MYLSGRLLIWTCVYEHVRFFAALRIIYNFAIQRIACRRNHIGYVCSRPHRCSPTSEMHWTVAKKKAYIWVQKYKQKWNKMADIYRNLTGSWENLTFYDTTSALTNLEYMIKQLSIAGWPVSCTLKKYLMLCYCNCHYCHILLLKVDTLYRQIRTQPSLPYNFF